MFWFTPVVCQYWWLIFWKTHWCPMFRRTSHHQGDLSSSSSRSRSWRLVHFLDHPSIQSASKMPFYQFCFPLEWKLEDCGGRSITPIPPICHISKLEPKSKCNLSTLNSKARQHSTEEKIQSPTKTIMQQHHIVTHQKNANQMWIWPVIIPQYIIQGKKEKISQ